MENENRGILIIGNIIIWTTILIVMFFIMCVKVNAININNNEYITNKNFNNDYICPSGRKLGIYCRIFGDTENVEIYSVTQYPMTQGYWQTGETISIKIQLTQAEYENRYYNQSNINQVYILDGVYTTMGQLAISRNEITINYDYCDLGYEYLQYCLILEINLQFTNYSDGNINTFYTKIEPVTTRDFYIYGVAKNNEYMGTYSDEINRLTAQGNQTRNWMSNVLDRFYSNYLQNMGYTEDMIEEIKKNGNLLEYIRNGISSELDYQVDIRDDISAIKEKIIKANFGTNPFNGTYNKNNNTYNGEEFGDYAEGEGDLFNTLGNTNFNPTYEDKFNNSFWWTLISGIAGTKIMAQTECETDGCIPIEYEMQPLAIIIGVALTLKIAKQALGRKYE